MKTARLCKIITYKEGRHKLKSEQHNSNGVKLLHYSDAHEIQTEQHGVAGDLECKIITYKDGNELKSEQHNTDGVTITTYRCETCVSEIGLRLHRTE